MKMKMTALVIGARYYDIKDERTGQMNRYTNVFTMEPEESGKSDRVGYQGGKISFDNSSVIQTLQGLEFPCECEVEITMRMDKTGKAKVTGHFLQPVPKVVGTKKAA